MKIILLIVVAFSLKVVENEPSVFDQQVKEIEQAKIGQAILNMAVLNYKLQGPVDELIESIKQFGRQLIERLEEENLDFEAIKSENAQKIKQLNQIVTDAEVEQTKQRKRIAQEYEPRKAEIETQLLRLKDEKSQNESQEKMQEALRKQQKQTFEKSIQDHGEFVDVIDEALKYMGTLLPRPDASLIEMDKVQLGKEQQTNLNRRLRSIKNKVENQKNLSQFVQTLVTLTDQQSFKQRHFIKSVIDLLNQLRKSVVESQNKLIEDEKQSQRAYDEWRNSSNGEVNNFDDQYDDLLQEREDIQSFIVDCENIIKIHESDVQLYTERINLETNNFLLSKQTHDELVKDINNELDVIQKAIKLLYTPAIFEYLKYKMNLLA
ncbi:hypothetical protein pb186bvf_012578 [Paramecium bursaria]